MLATLLLYLASFLITINAQYSPQDYLDAHNAARAMVGVANLIWDDSVAAYAQSYVNKRIGDCKLVHSGGRYGENIAWSSGDLSGTSAVGIWVKEKGNYIYNTNTCASGKVCGHYTQVVWQNTKSLGCARVLCENGGTIVSCNYDPRGNIVGQLPYGSTANITFLSPHPPPPPPSPPPPPPSFPLTRPSPPANSPYPAVLVPPNGKVSPFHSPVVDPIHEKRNVRLVGGIVAGGSVLLVGLVIIWFVSWRKRQRKLKKTGLSFDDHFQNGMGPRGFSYNELVNATNNFGENEKLGVGGFGAVYKGFLKDLTCFVAVKKISKQSKQGSKEYAAEVTIISQLRHKNIVKLIGWCHERELILVYEFMSNGSLDSHLFKGKSLLTWEVRYKIIQDIILALLYLHEEGDLCILHRDIKSSNVMLDSDFNAKLGDFGLARLVDHSKGTQTTAFAGTIGYMAPEYLISAKASKESDVYSFGIVALEIACGRRSIEQREEEGRISLLAWVWESYGENRLIDVVDSKLCTEFDWNQMERLLIVGLWCAHPDPNLRPTIRRVAHVINFESPLPIIPSKMPIAKYIAPTCPQVSSCSTSSSGQSLMSLTVPR